MSNANFPNRKKVIPVDPSNNIYDITSHDGSPDVPSTPPFPHTHLPSEVGAEPAFVKNTAFNKNFGTVAGTVCEGNDSRVINAVPNTRKVNNKALSSDIALNAADVGAEPAFVKNTAFNKNFGTAAGTVCEGNDSRVVNAVPNTRKVNNKALSSDITLNAADVGAPTVTEMNNAIAVAMGNSGGGAASKYTATLAWTGSANNYTMSITGVTHGKGVNASVSVRDSSGNFVGLGVLVNSSNGNVTLYSDSNFAGTAIIL